uniref:RNA helicase n=1 Tax=Chenopodium quinoa TaxID=63459 RepID=A0A803MCK7_CHEQI
MARNFNPGFRNHSNFPSYSCRNHKSPADDHRGRPPDVLEDRRRCRPNFIVNLSPLPGDTFNYKNSGVIQSVLVKHCKFRPYDVVFEWKSSSILLYYSQWICAREGVVKFWEALFNGEHNLTPILIRNVIVPSDVDEVNDRLKPLFSAKLRGLGSGEEVKKWEEKLQSLEKEIAAVFVAMKKHQHPQLFEENRKKKEVLKSEKELIVKRIQEFKGGVHFLRCYIEGGESKGGYSPYWFDNGGFDWPRIYHLIMRECRRFRDGLPVYAYRRELLREISSQQITVLIGETGSGKSTQLVQFLADSGLVADGSLICTQPRKIAANSLERRVKEESYGCYEDNAISCYRSFSSLQQFDAKLIYMTDHCLLQYCMNDKMLHGVSCILVDEAHERTLNTDLLLSMLKKLLPLRPDLRLIIMSATADAKQLSEYFFGCGMFSVVGRNFPVDVKYVPSFCEGTSQSLIGSSGTIAPYVFDVVRLVTEIHRTEKEGTILAFLTSLMEVEWACEMLVVPDAVPLALHGKLSYEEQSQVFQDYPGKRKVIFSTNVAETSLTIPGVKFVVDSGLAKESRFEPGSGMNVLRVCWISKSSANQRAGRAGRIEPGCCYRLYSLDDFTLMTAQQEPEIRRVHLGVAALKIIALGVKNICEFDFIDAPSSEAIDIAIRNLVQLGAVTSNSGNFVLTDLGQSLVKLGIEPRLGKLILGCVSFGLKKEGIVLAAVLANASSIFCRVGNLADKLKSDRLKVSFCHPHGDLFTLLSVYKAWEDVPVGKKRNQWCWDNSINAKAMQRCHDAICEWESCLKSELRIIVPSYWGWTPERVTEHDRNLTMAILASLAENVAMYSGSDQLGYKVALSGQYVQLHPACSLLMFNHKPDWVVFGELLSVSCQYLTCVTAFNQELLSDLTLPPLFDVSGLASQKLQVMTLYGNGKTLLKKFCGKYNNGLTCLVSRLRSICGDERISVEVDCDKDEIRLYTSSDDIEKVSDHVKAALDRERRSLQNECVEKCLYHGGPSAFPPVALFGSGAEIKHLELDKRCLTADVFHPNANAIDDKELLLLFESHASGVCAVHKSIIHGSEIEDKEKWGSITFLTPDAAKRAVAELNNFTFDGSLLRVNLSRATFGIDRAFSFPAVKAKLSWPRRISRGFAIVICMAHDADLLVSQFSNLRIGERYVKCERSEKSIDSVVISGIDREASEPEILQVLRSATNRRIMDFFLVRGDAVEDPTCHACEEALFREISVFMPKGTPQAARALEEIEGKALPGFQSWQKIQCQRLFYTSVCCSSAVYSIIKRELHTLVARFDRQRGTECTLDRNANGSCRVKISATATKVVAELRRPLEELMKGKIVNHASLTPAVLQLLFSRDGITLMKSLQQEMGIYIYVDRQSLNVRMIGPSAKVVVAEEQFVQCLLNLQMNKHLEIHLRGVELPHDLMKEVVKRFGPDLHGLKEKVPETEFTLNTRRHVISICGTKEAKQKVEEIVNEIALVSGSSREPNACSEKACSICLCELEDAYQLESCMHVFCRSCLVEQCESAIKNIDSFPICCAHEGCGVPFWLVDLKSLLSFEKLDELFMASLRAFVACSYGKFKFCPSPDCPSVYQTDGPGKTGEPFVCGACYAETCTRCHLEYHPYLSCEKYKEFKEDPDSSLREWWSGKEEYVKRCPICGHTIEKSEGCNHVECKCGKHLCWVCLEYFADSDECYNHLRAIHHGIT